MQRTESELRERYWLRVHGIQERWGDATRMWLKGGRRGIKRWMSIDHPKILMGIMESSGTYIAACKALGHWPRRES